MIKLKPLIPQLIEEKLSYNQLMNMSDPKRYDKSTRIPAKSLIVKAVAGRESWKFSYKSPKLENTTGLRHQGYLYFLQEDIDSGKDEMFLDCSVDCSCPDYRYRFSYANKEQGAGENGANSLNKGYDYPSSINEGPGLCKHLMSLKDYLQTEITSTVPAAIKKTTTIRTSAPKAPSTTPADAEQPPTTTAPKAPEKADAASFDAAVQAPQPPAIPEQPPEEEPPVDKNAPAPTPEPVDEPTPDQEPPVKPGVVSKLKKEKIKEEISSDKRSIIDALNRLCKNNRIFVIK